MPSQEEFLVSMLSSNEAITQDRQLAHGARLLRERLDKEIYDDAQLLNAEVHEAVIVQRQQSISGGSLPGITELHELEASTEWENRADESDEASEAGTELIFSKDEVECCMALAHARCGSGRDSAVQFEDEDGSSYITALAATIDAGGPTVPHHPSCVHATQYVRREDDTDKPSVDAESAVVERSADVANSSAAKESRSTQNSGVGAELHLQVSALHERLTSALDWRVISLDHEGLEEIIKGCDPLVTELERIVAAVKVQSQHRMKRQVAQQTKVAEEDSIEAPSRSASS